MSEILTLASEFIDRMSNPAYGIHVNEEYSLRFAKMLEADEFEGLLRREMQRLTDVNTLSPYSWLWLLGWARSKNVILDSSVLLDLTEKWSSVAIQAAAIDLATRRVDWGRRKYSTSVSEFNHTWLAELLQRCTSINDDNYFDIDDIRTKHAQNILVALLQVGSNITLDAASTLLRHHWPGQSSLLQFFWLLIDGLDIETQEVWISSLQPPERPFNNL